jgi:amino acid transporter
MIQVMSRILTQPPKLRRRLGLVLLILYGTGVTIGAGIYVLIGPIAANAGQYAPWAFLLAALVMGLTVASYAELCTRFPVAAGEAAYVRFAFKSRLLSTCTGVAMIGTAVIASATVAIGASGYISQFIDWPQPALIAAIVIALGSISILGVLESVLLASLFTLIEVGGLLAIIVTGFAAGVPLHESLFALPPFTTAAWSGIAFATLLAFFAFIGFEDLTNMAEETVAPERTIPFALTATLIVTTVLYMLVAAVAVTSVPLAALAASPAPLSLVFRSIVGISPAAISIIAIVATLNTILAEMTMATRVVYGLARQGDLPQYFGHVHAKTATPVLATIVVVMAIFLLTLLVPFLELAEATSIATLGVFAMVNLALIRIRLRDGISQHLRVPLWMPVAGFITSVAMIGTAAFSN